VSLWYWRVVGSLACCAVSKLRCACSSQCCGVSVLMVDVVSVSGFLCFGDLWPCVYVMSVLFLCCGVWRCVCLLVDYCCMCV
jgi:hypothetical protein